MDDFYKLNKHILRTLGSEAAVIYAVLENSSRYYEKQSLLVDGYFFCTIEQIEESTGLGRRKQAVAIEKLINAGLIKKRLIGSPPKRYFKIIAQNVQNEQINLHETDNSKCTKCTNQNVQNEQINLHEMSSQNVQNVQIKMYKTDNSKCSKRTTNKNRDNKNRVIRTDNKNREREKNIKKEKEFLPPSLEDVVQYHHERCSDVDPKKFFDYYEASGWIDGNGKKVRNWKQKFITWEGRDKKAKPSSYSDEIQRGLKELEAMFDE